MGRSRKPITEDGYLLCSRCKESKHITDFYLRGAFFIEIEGIWYGKPGSWCKSCQKAASAEVNKRRYAAEKERERQLQEHRDKSFAALSAKESAERKAKLDEARTIVEEMGGTITGYDFLPDGTLNVQVS